MEQWFLLGAGLALVLTWKAARWTARVDADLKTLKGFMEEIRGDIQKIGAKIGLRLAAGESPQRSTELEEKVADCDQVTSRQEGSNLPSSPRYEDWNDYLRNAPRATEDLHDAVAETPQDRTPPALPLR